MISRLIAAKSLFHLPAIRTMASSSRAPLTNVLSKSKSPYLLQHKDNPVAASIPLVMARLLIDSLSGKSSHRRPSHWPRSWTGLSSYHRATQLVTGEAYEYCGVAECSLVIRCHVLAHESFEDQETARIMNEHFVNIKVDREERPDVDRMYMTYLQATQGGGGWPLSVCE